MMVRSDIYYNLKDSNYVAFCYSGEMYGSLAFYDDTKSKTIIIQPSSYMSEEDIIADQRHAESQFQHFELWSFIHEIEEEDVLQDGINRLHGAYTTLYPMMEFMQNATFKGFNEEV